MNTFLHVCARFLQILPCALLFLKIWPALLLSPIYLICCVFLDLFSKMDSSLNIGLDQQAPNTNMWLVSSHANLSQLLVALPLVHETLLPTLSLSPWHVHSFLVMSPKPMLSCVMSTLLSFLHAHVLSCLSLLSFLLSCL
jgi:hypothetical protein